MRDEGRSDEDLRKRTALRLLKGAFFMGLVFAAVVAAPGVAILSVVVVPLNDVCQLIPHTHGSASAILRLLEIPDATAATSAATAATSAATAATSAAAILRLLEIPDAALASVYTPSHAYGMRLPQRPSYAGGDGSIRQHTSAYVSIRMSEGKSEEVDEGNTKRTETEEPEANGASLPRRLIEDCLCDPQGSAWEVMGVGNAAMKEHLSIRNASDVFTPQLLDVLDILRYQGILEMSEEALKVSSSSNEAFGGTDCSNADASLFPSCKLDMAAYANDLDVRRGRLRAAAAYLRQAALEAVQVTTALRTNVSRLMALSDSTTTAMFAAVRAAGSCDLVHAHYESVRSPLCDGVVDAVLATWALLILATLLWAPLVVAISLLAETVSLTLPSRRLSFGESEYSLLLDAEQMLAEKDQVDALPDDMNIETQPHHTN